MNQVERSLWTRLEQHKIADKQHQVYIDKLANDKGWCDEYIDGAILEYKRFMFLATISPTPVTPSLVIDEVWHTHLLFSRSYWNEFCPNILGKALHHEPSGEDDAHVMKQQFNDTQILYKQYFGTLPPERYWLTPEPTRERKTHTAALVGLTLAGIAGIAAAESSDYIEPETDIIGIILFIVLVLAFYYIFKLFTGSSKKNNKNRNRNRNRNNNGSGSDCSSSGCSSCSGGGSSCGGGGD